MNRLPLATGRKRERADRYLKFLSPEASALSLLILSWHQEVHSVHGINKKLSFLSHGLFLSLELPTPDPLQYSREILFRFGFLGKLPPKSVVE